MEQDLLKYFVGEGTPTTEDIKPINIDNKVINLSSIAISTKTLVTNDNNYFIRYGGDYRQNSYNTINVFDANSLEEESPLYSFDTLKINGHTFLIDELRQDEDGRFYGIGRYLNGENMERYLILLNNFIQDGECYIRKFYSNTTMGIGDVSFSSVAKKQGSADYYIWSVTGVIYHYKIDVQSGNILETYSYTEGGTIIEGIVPYQFEIVGDNICLLELWENYEKTAYECKKLIIDTTKDIANSYTTQSITYQTLGSNILVGERVNNFNYYAIYLTANGNNYTLGFKKIDIDGNIKTYSINTTINSTNISCSIINNYLFQWDGLLLRLYYFDFNNTNIFIEFGNINFSGKFLQPAIIQKFNLIYLCGINSNSSIAYSKNIYSQGYSSIPYYNNNFMIPQYLNILSKQNDDKSIIFSRDVSNRFLAGNQLTATFNVPNYMLNGNQIKRQDVNGQTNMVIETDNKSIQKNRFESLNLSHTYNLYVIDNTNENNMVNQVGSNRIANSVWKTLDYEDVACLKLRITYDDLSDEIIDLTPGTTTGTSYTFTYQVTGNVIKLEYLSEDLQTIYATYRCNLEGTNTIEQTITVSSN